LIYFKGKRIAEFSGHQFFEIKISKRILERKFEYEENKSCGPGNRIYR
jgi:hypothetical protein